MAEEFVRKDGTGQLNKNSYKTTDNHPDYRGDAKIDGKNKELSAWVKTNVKGEKYLSLSIQEPYKKEEVKTQSIPVKEDQDMADDDLPF
jgi:uncharacterized protein (DUF736 family)